MNQLSNIEMNKLMHYFFIGFEYKLNVEKKKLLLDIFKRKSCVKIKDMKNYVEVSTFEKSISHRKKDSEFYEEIKKLKTDEVYAKGWFNELSSDCQRFLNSVFRKKWFDDTDELVRNHKGAFNNTEVEIDDDVEVNNNKLSNDNWFNLVSDRFEKFSDYVKENFKENLYFDENGDLKEEFKNSLAYENEAICDYDKNLEMIVYCIKEKRYDLLDIKNDEIVLKDDVYEKYVINGENIPLTTREKMKMSLKRTIDKFNEYAYCNADLFKYFITLTFAQNENNENNILNVVNDRCLKEIKIDYSENVCDYGCCIGALNKFLKRLKIALKRYNEKNGTLYELTYLGVPEYQKNGAIHYHFLFGDLPDEFLYNVANWLDYDYINKKKKNGLGIKYWTYGKSDVDVIRDKARVTSYVSKYMMKSLYELDETEYFDRLNKKRYFNSFNLEEAKIEYTSSFRESDLDIYSSYEKEVLNTFNDSKIKKVIYQVKLLNEKDVLNNKEELIN